MSVIFKGQVKQGYIAAMAGALGEHSGHDEVRFSFRVLPLPIRTHYFTVLADFDSQESKELYISESMETFLTAWDCKLPADWPKSLPGNPGDTLPITAENILNHLHHVVFNRMSMIVTGTGKSDVDPKAGDKIRREQNRGAGNTAEALMRMLSEDSAEQQKN